MQTRTIDQLAQLCQYIARYRGVEAKWGFSSTQSDVTLTIKINKDVAYVSLDEALRDAEVASMTYTNLDKVSTSVVNIAREIIENAKGE